jgi:hypothetical protein
LDEVNEMAKKTEAALFSLIKRVKMRPALGRFRAGGESSRLPMLVQQP